MSMVNKRELSEVVGVTERTLTTYSKQGMPIAAASARGKASKFDTVDVINWMIQKEVTKLSFGGNLDLTEETARLKHHQANNEALKEDQLRGSLIPEIVIREHGAGMVSAFRSKMLALTTKIRNRFSDLSDDVIDEIQRLITEALEELGSDGIPAEVRERIRRHLLSSETAPEPDD